MKPNLKNLDDLLEFLNGYRSYVDYVTREDFERSAGINPTRMPIFDDSAAPADTAGVYSWDANRLLVFKNDGYKIVSRLNQQ